MTHRLTRRIRVPLVALLLAAAPMAALAQAQVPAGPPAGESYAAATQASIVTPNSSIEFASPKANTFATPGLSNLSTQIDASTTVISNDAIKTATKCAQPIRDHADHQAAIVTTSVER